MSTYKGNCSILIATIQLTADLILKMKVKLSLPMGCLQALIREEDDSRQKRCKRTMQIKEAILHIKENAYKIVEAKNCKII